MKIGFICLNLPGHLNPMSTLARELQKRGHDVVFLYLSKANGLPCLPGEGRDTVNATRADVSKLVGWEALAFYCGVTAKETDNIFETLPRMVQKAGIDALVLDPIQFFVELSARKMEVPYVNVALAVYLDYTGHTPLCAYDWAHESTPQAVARNLEGVARFTKLTYNERTMRFAEEAGIKVDWDAPSSVFSKLAYITQIPAEFDFDNPLTSTGFYHTGPLFEPSFRPRVDFPWDRLTDEPLIYASMGTILNGQVDVFRTIIAAAAKYRGTQLVLSIGDQIDVKQLSSVPSNAIVVSKAPQLEILKLASVCITHAGLNTVLESLSYGVPQVAIPITFDQPGVAARIAARKTGVTTRIDQLTPDHLSNLLEQAIENPEYRENARKIQAAIAKNNGLSKAADIVERAFGVWTTAIN